MMVRTNLEDRDMEANRGTVLYKNCQRNLTADIGLLTIDGCMQYIHNTINQSSLRCDNCGCHRSFHRKVEETIGLDLQEQIRGDKNGMDGIDLTDSDDEKHMERPRPISGRRNPKRYTDGEVEMMMEFADTLGWKMPGRDLVATERLFKFCDEMGITKMQFKAWLHTHKKLLSPHL